MTSPHRTGDDLGSARQPMQPSIGRVMRSLYLALTLFLLTADLLFVNAGGIKLKYGYFLILGMWLFAPRPMYASVRDALRRLPKYPLLLLVPIAIAVATSVNVRSSVGWALWLGFDAFTVVTVYAFLKSQRLTAEGVQDAATWALGLVALFGAVQFICIFGFGYPVFSPQIHLGVFRLNGLSGWPHFLNIYAFLLLPIVFLRKRFSATTIAILALLIFVLAQSTAKTGWVLFVAFAVLLLVLNRAALVRKVALIAVPLAVVALLLPLPATQQSGPALSGAEKIARFGANFTETTSVRDRLLINTQGVKVWLAHPWFGVGPRAYETYVFTRFDIELPGENKFDVENRINPKNENIWIEFLAETGVLFTAGFVVVLLRALWVPRWRFANPLQMGAWIALVLYYAISGQVSQTGLLTIVYAVFGIYFFARELPIVPAAGSVQKPGPDRSKGIPTDPPASPAPKSITVRSSNPPKALASARR
jgi:O-antigen ligase